MLEHLGEQQASGAVKGAVYRYLRDSSSCELPIELGGSKTTSQVGDAVRSMIEEM